jgi:predicted nucleic acid-binding protein
MRRIFIDTNVLLRPFVNDDSQQVAEAVNLFRRAKEW